MIVHASLHDWLYAVGMKENDFSYPVRETVMERHYIYLSKFEACCGYGKTSIAEQWRTIDEIMHVFMNLNGHYSQPKRQVTCEECSLMMDYALELKDEV